MQSNSHTGALIVMKSYLVFAITALNVYLGFLPGIKIPTSNNVLSSSAAATSLDTFIGSYYKGTNFETLKVSGVESTAIGFDWGNNTPYKSIGRNGFSVRWNGTFDFKNSATYKFTAAYDDGFRLYVDGIPVIDDWKPGSFRSDTKEISLAAGQHNLQVDYFENIGTARVALVWAETTTPPPPTSSCWPTALPIGALVGQPGPVFCSVTTSGKDTAVASTNGWLDEFEHGLNLASFANTKYKVFENIDGSFYKTQHWLHNNHWMVDIAPDSQANANDSNGVGGAMIRPDRTFKFENGKLVIETDYAAAIEAYQTGAWGEIVVTTAAAPTKLRANGLYAYDMFPGHYSLGLRMQPDRHTTAALMDNTTNGELDGGRLWEISFFQVVGKSVFGGAPFGGLENFWRECKGTDPDTFCRDRFRLELTQTTFTVYVNGEKYFEQTGMPPLPDELMSGDLYVYVASISWNSPADTLRYHWDRFAVNPTTGPTPAPGFGLETSELVKMAH